MTTIGDLNRGGPAAFATALAALFEHSPWVVERASAQAPFETLGALHAALCGVIRSASDADKLRLIRAHPDLAGKYGVADPLTPHSRAEQADVGLDRLTPPEFERFQRLNAAYRQRFDMPFVVCVRRHTKGSILRQFEQRLDRARGAEIGVAIEEIARIAALRLVQTLEPDGSLPVAGRLSTHVLDTHAGRPAQGIAVTLVELGDGPERMVASAVTNRDGRSDAPLIAGRPVPIGTYELRFAVGAYFARSGASVADPPFLDVVPVRFAVAEPEGHYHVPLLVTPWSYSTYRGS